MPAPTGCECVLRARSHCPGACVATSVREYIWVIAALLCVVQLGPADAFEYSLIWMGTSLAGYRGAT